MTDLQRAIVDRLEWMLMTGRGPIGLPLAARERLLVQHTLATIDDGRPPLDPATVAHDDAYMAGLIRGRQLEREALRLRFERLPQALTVELSTGLYVDIDTVLAMIDDTGPT